MKPINRRHFIAMAGAGATALGIEAAAAPHFSLGTDRAVQQQNAAKTLILLAHPTFDKSVANKALVEAVKDLPNVSVIDIYAAPFAKETYRQPLTDATAVVFQFPFYWLSAPSQLKKWCDEVFMTDVVKGKKLLVATTTGSEYEAYRSGGRNLFTIDELLRPYQALAHHAGMVWQTPFAVYGASRNDAAESIRAGAVAYRERIASLAQ